MEKVSGLQSPQIKPDPVPLDEFQGQATGRIEVGYSTGKITGKVDPDSDIVIMSLSLHELGTFIEEIQKPIMFFIGIWNMAIQ